MDRYNIIIGKIIGISFFILSAILFIQNKEPILRVLVAVLGLIIFFMEDLIAKPINLIGWTISDEDKKEKRCLKQ